MDKPYNAFNNGKLFGDRKMDCKLISTREISMEKVIFELCYLIIAR